MDEVERLVHRKMLSRRDWSIEGAENARAVQASIRLRNTKVLSKQWVDDVGEIGDHLQAAVAARPWLQFEYEDIAAETFVAQRQAFRSYRDRCC